tara:strand:+ start:603 stop:1061 length:459 start_codon:yes stop_codon:yes gene_type:complete
MIKKILLILFATFLLNNCEYKPIYSDLNNLNYKIIVTEFTGDKKLNKFIIDNLKRNNQKKTNETIQIKIDTQYTKTIAAKDTAGTITNYQTNAITTFQIEKNKISETFVVNEKFNFQKISDKYEEKRYEENIKRNLAASISQKLILRLAVIK